MSSPSVPQQEVVCITLNPALDLTGHLPSLRPGELNRVDAASLHAAGKGINVAKILAQLGAKVTVTGFLGEANETEFVSLFSELGLADECIRVAGATRINVKMVAQNQAQAVTEINFPSFSVNADAFNQLRKKLLELSKSKPLMVIAGSLPHGVSAEQSAALITEIQALGCRVVFDSSKAALSEGVKAAPYLVKPNLHELNELLAQEPTQGRVNLVEISKAARQLHQQGCANVVVSLGEQGVIWLNKEGTLFAKPPHVTVVSTVGAGDSLVAGLCWGELQNWPKHACLCFATALSAHGVCQIGVGIQDINEIEQLARRVVIEPL